MVGQLVMVRALGDRPAILQITERIGDMIYTLSPEEYGKRSRGGESLFPIGFPVSRAYEIEEELFRKLASAYSSGDSVALAALWRDARALNQTPN